MKSSLREAFEGGGVKEPPVTLRHKTENLSFHTKLIFIYVEKSYGVG